MKKNMGTMDRVVRLAVAAALAALYFTGMVGGVLGVIFVVVAAVFLVTSLLGWCPGYLPLGLSTCKPPKQASSAG